MNGKTFHFLSRNISHILMLMKALDYLMTFEPISKERLGFASRSEVKRWFDQNSVFMNGELTQWNEDIDTWTNGVFSITLFPNGKTVSM